MDFTLIETQKEYQEKARRLAVERLTPKYQEREKRGSVEKDLQIEMGMLGLIASEIPEDLGGRGLDCVTCTGYVDHPFKKSTSRRRKIVFPACKHRRVGVESDVVDSILMLERRYSYVMEKLLE